MPVVIPTSPMRTTTPVPAPSAEDNLFKGDFQFSYNSGDFLRLGIVPLCDGLSAWKQICYKQAFVQRGSKLAYNSDFGIDYELIRQQTTRPAIESALASEITRALMSMPGTASVGNFTYEWEGSSVQVGFEATPRDGAPGEFHFLWVA